MLKQRTMITLAAALLLLAGTSYSVTGSARWGSGGPPGTTPLSAAEIEELVYMREEEKLARDSYLELGDEWGLIIFSSIAASEQRHMNSLEQMLDKYNIEDPIVDETDVGNFVNHVLQDLYNYLIEWGMTSMMDGLYVGGTIEEVDILDLEEAINVTDPDHEDLIATYENLLCGSRNHLRAFVGQIEMYSGEAYVPFMMSEDQVAEIINSPMEQRCGAGNRKGKGKSKNGR